jgi:hypothetical protein
MANISNSQDIYNWIRFNNKKWIRWDANTDWAEIAFKSNNNDDTTFDFNLGDDGSEWFRFLFNNSWKVAWDVNVASFKQKLFAHAQLGEFPLISLAIWDTDTGFNRGFDWSFDVYSNNEKIQTFNQTSVPVIAENLWFNVKIKKITQTQYDALGAWRPNNVFYLITD